MKHEYMLMQYYMRYLQKVRKVSESTIGHYTQALNKISKMLVERDKIQETVYEIRSLDELKVIREFIFHEPEFMALDNRGNRMYSAGLNNYVRFASGEELFGKQKEMLDMDIEIPIGEKVTIKREEWKRSAIIKIQTLETAEYKCEINPQHHTFIANNTRKQYMEGHHVIPMKWQDKFRQSIDVYANVICLCPVCHRLLHYGMELDKRDLLNQIYAERAGRLVSSGIKVSKEEFMELST